MRILVAIDGSEYSEVALDLVDSIRWPAGSTIDVVQAVSTGIAVFGGPWPPIPPVDTTAFDDDIRRQAQQDLDAAVDKLARQGRTIETAMASGRAADVKHQQSAIATDMCSEARIKRVHAERVHAVGHAVDGGGEAH